MSGVITVGNNFGINQATGVVSQYTPPTVTPGVTNPPAVPPSIGATQTIVAGGTLAAGNWQIISGDLTNAGTTDVTVAPITL